MADYEEHETQYKRRIGSTDSGLVVSGKKTWRSWLHKILQSFNSSLMSKSGCNKKCFWRHCMKSNIDCQTASTISTFSWRIKETHYPGSEDTYVWINFHGRWWFCMMRSGQYSIPSESDLLSTTRQHAAFNSSTVSSSNQPINPQDCGIMDRRIEETLHVIETRKRHRPVGLCSKVSSRKMEQGPLQEGPQTKLLTYECQEDIDVF